MIKLIKTGTLEKQGQVISLSNYKNLKTNENLDYPKFNSSLPITSSCENLIPSVCGVYFFHDLRGIHYIGETVNLKSRFKQHSSKEKNKKLAKVRKTVFGKMYFSWVKTNSKMEALKFQKKWIRIFNPNCNEILFKQIT